MRTPKLPFAARERQRLAGHRVDMLELPFDRLRVLSALLDGALHGHQLDVAGDDRHRSAQIVHHPREHLPDVGEPRFALAFLARAAQEDRPAGLAAKQRRQPFVPRGEATLLVEQLQRAEVSAFAGDGHAQKLPHRHAQLPRHRTVVVRRGLCVVQPDRFAGLRHVPGDPLAGGEPHRREGLVLLAERAAEEERPLLVLGQKDRPRRRPGHGQRLVEDPVEQVLLTLGGGHRLLHLVEQIQIADRFGELAFGAGELEVAALERLEEQHVVQNAGDLHGHRLHELRVVRLEGAGPAVEHLDRSEQPTTHVPQRGGDERPGPKAGEPVDLRVEARVVVGVIDAYDFLAPDDMPDDALVRGDADLLERGALEHARPQLAARLVEHEQGRRFGAEQRRHAVDDQLEQPVEIARGGKLHPDVEHRGEALALPRHRALEVLQLAVDHLKEVRLRRSRDRLHGRAQ